jgi:hypothetical protein
VRPEEATKPDDAEADARRRAELLELKKKLRG